MDPDPPFNFHYGEKPIYSRPRFLPPSRIEGATITGSMIADGCTIREGTTINRSLIGLRCSIGPKATVSESILMGADWFDSPDRVPAGAPAVGIGEGTVIEKAIVDKNCRIGKNCTIKLPKDFPKDGERTPVVVRDGIIVVPKDAILPDGWRF